MTQIEQAQIELRERIEADFMQTGIIASRFQEPRPRVSTGVRRLLRDAMEKERLSQWLESDVGDEENRICLLAGVTGCGKTSSMIAAGVELKVMVPDAHIELIDWLNLTDYYPEYTFNLGDMSCEYYSLQRCDLLIIDEVSAINDKRTSRQQLERLFDFRYQRECKTIMTTNLNSKEFSEKVSARIASRCRTVIKFTNDSFRTKKEW